MSEKPTKKDKLSLSDEDMVTERPMGRRSSIAVLGGAILGAAGVVAAVRPERAEAQVTDRDPSDPAGRGRGGVSDSDPSDPAGRGRGRGVSDSDPSDPAGRGRSGLTDSDPSDPAGRGRGRRSCSDSDPRDPAGRGRRC